MKKLWLLRAVIVGVGIAVLINAAFTPYRVIDWQWWVMVLGFNFLAAIPGSD